MSDQAPVPTDEERIAAIVNYDLGYRDMEKLALETMARTARDPLFCFELSMEMQRLRRRINDERRHKGAES